MPEEKKKQTIVDLDDLIHEGIKTDIAKVQRTLNDVSSYIKKMYPGGDEHEEEHHNKQRLQEKLNTLNHI